MILLLWLAHFTLPVLSRSTKDAIGGDGSLQDPEVSAVLHGQDALGRLEQGSDCFRRAAGLIRVRCGQVDMDEQERVRAAISMTLCELATAKHHSSPLECASFSLEQLHQHSAQLVERQGECVDALSRSAQFWSSYSGYLREIPQLCFSFRRWHDIDTAKEIYRNISQEKMALIQLLVNRERTSRDHLDSWELHLSEMQDVTVLLQSSYDRFQSIPNHVNSLLNTGFEKALSLFSTSLAELVNRSHEDHGFVVQRIDAALSRASEAHAQSLQGTLTHFQQHLIPFLDDASSQFTRQSEEAFVLANYAREHWLGLTQEFATMRESAKQLSDVSLQTIDALTVSSQHINALQKTQEDTTESASRLAQSLSLLTLMVQDDISKINVSVSQLKQQAEFVGPRWWQDQWMKKIFEILLHLDPSSSAYLAQLPVFRILSVLSLVCYRLLQYSMSGLMSMLIVFFSFRKYLCGPILSSHTIEPMNKSQLALNDISQSVYYQLPASPTWMDPRLTRTGLSYTSRSTSQPTRFSRIPDRLCT